MTIINVLARGTTPATAASGDSIERRFGSQLKRTLRLLHHDAYLHQQQQKHPFSVDVLTELPKAWAMLTKARQALAAEYLTQLTRHASSPSASFPATTNSLSSSSSSSSPPPSLSAPPKGLGNRLWLLFYKEIEPLQSKLRAGPAREMDATPAEQRAQERALWKGRLEAVMLEGARLLTRALGEIQAAGSEEEGREGVMNNNNEESVAVMVALGDLARYAGRMMDAVKDFENTLKCLEQAEGWYMQAVQTRPGHGRAYNQLAIMATLKSQDVGEREVLTAAFNYTRALLADGEPFAAKDNLIALLDRWRRAHEAAVSAATKAKSLEWLRQARAEGNGTEIEKKSIGRVGGKMKTMGGSGGGGVPTAAAATGQREEKRTAFLQALLKGLHMVYTRVDLDALPSHAHLVGLHLTTLAQSFHPLPGKSKQAMNTQQRNDLKKNRSARHPMGKDEDEKENQEEDDGGWWGEAAADAAVELCELHSVYMQAVVVVTGALWARAEAVGLFSSTSYTTTITTPQFQQRQQQHQQHKPPADVKGALALVMEIGLALAKKRKGNKGRWDEGSGPALLLLLQWLEVNQGWLSILPEGNRTHEVVKTAWASVGRGVGMGGKECGSGRERGEVVEEKEEQGEGKVEEKRRVSEEEQAVLGVRGFWRSKKEGQKTMLLAQRQLLMGQDKGGRRGGRDTQARYRRLLLSLERWTERAQGACCDAEEGKHARLDPQGEGTVAAVGNGHAPLEATSAKTTSLSWQSITPSSSSSSSSSLSPPSSSSNLSSADLATSMASLVLSSSDPRPPSGIHPARSSSLSLSAAASSNSSSSLFSPFSLFSSPLITSLPPSTPPSPPPPPPLPMCPSCSNFIEAEVIHHTDACCEWCGHVFNKQHQQQHHYHHQQHQQQHQHRDTSAAAAAAASAATAAGFTPTSSSSSSSSGVSQVVDYPGSIFLSCLASSSSHLPAGGGLARPPGL